MSDLQDPRVLFAAERTLMAWNRTSIALIAFGFLIERSEVLIRALSAGEADSVSMLFTVWIGLLFILLGAIAAVYSSLQYARVLRTLSPVEFPVRYDAGWGMAVNVSVAVLGFVLAVALLLSR
jgi:putative membrane protein